MPSTTDHRDRRHRRPAPPDRPRRRRLPRRPVRGDRGARRRPPPRARRAAHRVGQVGGLLRRDAAAAPARRRARPLLVSPLLALMRDQVAAAERAGVRAVAINSTNAHEWDDVLGALARDEVDVLLVSPERLNNPRVPRRAAARARSSGSACSSSTRRTASATGATTSAPTTGGSRELIAQLPAGVPVLATTATANSRVVADVAEQLGASAAPTRDEVLTIRGPLARASLRLGVLRLPDARDPARLAAQPPRRPARHRHHLHAHGRRPPRTPRGCCARRGHDVRAYTGPDRPRRARSSRERCSRTTRSRRSSPRARSAWASTSPTSASSCTSAPRRRPSRTTSRSAAPAAPPTTPTCCCCPAPRTATIWQYFATASMPDAGARRARCIAELGDRAALDARARGAASTSAAPRSSCCSRCSTSTAPCAGCRAAGSSTGQPWTYDAERYERIAAARAAEQQHMLDYEHDRPGAAWSSCSATSTTPTAAPCGRCDNCAGAWYPTDVADECGEPRPTHRSTGSACRSSRARSGRPAPTASASRSRATSPPASAPRRAARSPGSPTSAGAARCAQLFAPGAARRRRVAARCSTPRPRARRLGRGPSARSASSRCRRVARPLLVDSLARGTRRGRPAAATSAALDPTAAGPTGEPGGNSVYRLAGVWDRFDASERPRRCSDGGPVLLVDDLADSRWTLTVAARELRQAGAVPCCRSRWPWSAEVSDICPLLQ